MVPARTLMLLVSSLVLVAACSREPARPAPEREDPAVRAAFEQGERGWREARAADLVAPDGWTTLVGLHWLDPGPHYAGRARDNGIRLAVGPDQFGMFDVRGDDVMFRPHPGSALRIDDGPARAGRLRTDEAPEGPSRITFDGGKGVVNVIRRGERFALRVRHADAPTRTGFGGLTYWRGGPDWVVEGRWRPHPPGRTIEIGDIVGTLSAKPNPGRVEFVRDGRTFALEALEGEAGGLFLVFADRTSGHGSYSAGRFLDAPPPAGGRVRLDFNRAYNPPCAFTSFATCPLPPAANRLDLAIEAGEKAYTVAH
ncbi:DUF1684 domain-containing protein [Lysobacter humi (ex Lee et al. 2017)]